MLIHSFKPWFHPSLLPICPFYSYPHFNYSNKKTVGSSLFPLLPSLYTSISSVTTLVSATIISYLYCQNGLLTGLPASILDHSIVKWLLKMKLCLFFFWMKPLMAYQIKSEVLTMPVRSLQDLVSTYLSNFTSDYSSHLYYNMLAIYNCITNYPRLTGLKQQIFIIWQFLWVRNSGLAYLVGFGSGFLMWLQTRYWLGLQPLLTHGLGLRGFNSKMSHPNGCWQEVLSSGPFHKASEGPYNVVPDFPQSEWSEREQGESCNAFYGLFSEVTHHHFCHNLCVTKSVQPPLKGSGIRLHLLKWGVSKDLQIITSHPLG